MAPKLRGILILLTQLHGGLWDFEIAHATGMAKWAKLKKQIHPKS